MILMEKVNCYDMAREWANLILQMEELMSEKEKLNNVAKEIELDARISVLDVKIHEIKQNLMKIEYKDSYR
jgi:hypothetical protein